jgi:SAM-dependent methyltransferase
MLHRLKTLVNRAAAPLGIEVVRKGNANPHLRPYVGHRAIVRGAEKAGMSVADYVEIAGNERGVTQGVMGQLDAAGVFTPPPACVLEVGTGTGKFASRVFDVCKPERYESYEPDARWAGWLEREIGVISMPTDGHSLRHTPDRSVDLVMAHGVFLYLPFLTSCRYFAEMARVLRPGGRVAFDILSESCFGEAELEAWIGSNELWPTILPREFVIELFRRNGLEFRGGFFSRPELWKTEYLLFGRS